MEYKARGIGILHFLCSVFQYFPSSSFLLFFICFALCGKFKVKRRERPELNPTTNTHCNWEMIGSLDLDVDFHLA